MKNILLNPIFKSHSRILLILIPLIALVGYFSMDIYFPSLPAIVTAYHTDAGTAQLTLTLFLCGLGFSQLIYGPLADYYGRRPIILLGFCIYLLGSLFLISAQSISTLLLSRLIQGTGAGASASLARVLLRDNFVGAKMARAASCINIAMVLAMALAPALGGIIQEMVGHVGNFAIMGIFGGLVSLLTLCFLPESNKAPKCSLNITFIAKDYCKILLNKNFISHMLCAGFGLGAILAYSIINPFLLEGQLHLSPKMYGLITLLIATGELVGTYLNSLFVVRFGIIKLTYIGILLMISAALLLIGFNSFNIFSVSSLFIVTFFITMSTGIILPNATAGAFSAVESAIGTAGALYGFFQMLISIVTTYLITRIAVQSVWHLAFIFLILGLASLMIYTVNLLLEKQMISEVIAEKI